MNSNKERRQPCLTDLASLKGIALTALIITEDATEANVEEINFVSSPEKPNLSSILNKKGHSNLSKGLIISNLRRAN